MRRYAKALFLHVWPFCHVWPMILAASRWSILGTHARVGQRVSKSTLHCFIFKSPWRNQGANRGIYGKRWAAGGVEHCAATVKASVDGLADTFVSLHFLHFVSWFKDSWFLLLFFFGSGIVIWHSCVEHHKSLSTTSCVLTCVALCSYFRDVVSRDLAIRRTVFWRWFHGHLPRGSRGDENMFERMLWTWFGIRGITLHNVELVGINYIYTYIYM